jgi:hypothetical protein
MDDYIVKDPTTVDPESLWSSNTTVRFASIAFEEWSNRHVTIPDGEYSLEFLYYPDQTADTPSFYLLNSDKKYTGINISLQYFKKEKGNYNYSNPITFNLPKDLEGKKLKVISLKGKYEIIPPKNRKIKGQHAEQLTSFFSKKLQKHVQFTKYSLYIPPQNEITKTAGTIVSGDTNKPIKGTTVEKTD